MRRLLSAWAVIALLACPVASAQQGVTIDPDSPAAKEYALPLEAARQSATSKKQNRGAGSRSETSAPAPLFGEGIGDDAQATSGGAAAAGSPSGTDGRSSPEIGIEEVVRPATSPGAPDGGGVGTSLLIIGGGALTVGAGAAAGLALRRRRAG